MDALYQQEEWGGEEKKFGSFGSRTFKKSSKSDPPGQQGTTLV